MPKKKSVKKKPARSKKINPDKKRSIVLKNLILFTILSLVSFTLYFISSNELLINFFYLLTIILGFIAGAFLIILLVFLTMKLIKK